MQTPNHQLTGAFMLGMYISTKRPLEPFERWIFDEMTSSRPSKIMQGILERVGKEALEKINEDR